MSVEKVKNYLAQYGASDSVMVFEQSCATVELTAAAVGCEPARIAKTLSFDVNGQVVLIVASGDVKIDNAKYKAKFGARTKMLVPDEAVLRTGFAIGAISPFGTNKGVAIYLDESLKRFETVYPGGGCDSSIVKVTISELEEYSKYTAWVDVTKPRE